jgi:hypothetical protein
LIAIDSHIQLSRYKGMPGQTSFEAGAECVSLVRVGRAYATDGQKETNLPAAFSL